MTLVFIHGRNQQGRDWKALRTAWTTGLNDGLERASLPPVDPAEVCFPFYGDLLHAEDLQARKAGRDIELESLRTLDAVMPERTQQVEADILHSMYVTASQDDPVVLEGRWEKVLKLPFARRIADYLADRTEADQEIIERFLHDVAVYLTVARKAVLDLIRTQLPSPPGEPVAGGDLIIIAHSLGAAVTHDLLRDETVRTRTRALVTAGSPLGLQGVYRNLLSHGPVHPRVPAWLTVWDPQDFVALGHPVKQRYGSPIKELRVENPDGQAHSIAHYLGHTEVAAWIGSHLKATDS